MFHKAWSMCVCVCVFWEEISWDIITFSKWTFAKKRCNNCKFMKFSQRAIIYNLEIIIKQCFICMYIYIPTSPGVTCYVLSGFCNLPLISIENTSQLSVIIIIFLKVYTFKTILWVSIHSRGLKTYISARLTSTASKV